ncbi:BA75_04907T0 [Komagataella pastoris]|uniref:ATP-dependent RNA helicase n=1 Tax=Komagataella pastoris TaxID=4922 RepID=A0A1B2JIL9_PICPA|nr:BA75_04907T0 [Komagataella pastoris]
MFLNRAIRGTSINGLGVCSRWIHQSFKRDAVSESNVISSVKKQHLKRNPKSNRSIKRNRYNDLKIRVEKDVIESLEMNKKSGLRSPHDRYSRLKIKFDPRFEGSFKDFGVSTRLDRQLSEKLHINQPTDTQRRILSILCSDLSVLAVSSQRSGNSTCLLLYALSMKGRSLLLAPTTLAVLQLQKLCHSLEVEGVAFLYRSSEEEELNQGKQLDLKTPKVIVATPQRMLDLISEKKSDPLFMNLHELNFLGVDDADMQLLNDNKKVVHERPAQILINYIIKLKETVTSNKNSQPLQFGFIETLDISNKLLNMIKENKWNASRTLLPIGLLAKGDVLARARINQSASLSIVISDSKKVLDLKLPPLSSGMEVLSKIRSPIGREFDENAKKHLTSQLQNDKTLSQFISAEVSDALSAVSMKLKTKKSLLICPDSITVRTIMEQLTALGYSSKQLSSSTTNFFNDENEQSQFLISTPSQLPGVNLEGLTSVICLGLHALKDSKTLVLIAGKSQSPHVTLILSKSKTTMVERFMIERMLLKSGVANLTPLIGETDDYDEKAYQELFSDIHGDNSS